VSDIVDRLRQLVTIAAALPDSTFASLASSLITEAVDEIEQLRKQFDPEAANPVFRNMQRIKRENINSVLQENLVMAQQKSIVLRMENAADALTEKSSK